MLFGVYGSIFVSLSYSRKIAKIMRSLFTVLVATIIPFCALSAQNSGEHQDVFVPISKYIQSGDAEKLSAWFASNLEIDILGNINVTSKAQAKQVIKDFFSNNTPKAFTVVHRSGKPPMKYAIGNLSAGGQKFRVTLFVKTQDDGNFIQSIRIEKE